MGNMKLYKKLSDIELLINKDSVLAMSKLQDLKDVLMQEERQKGYSGSRKKAIKKIVAISNRILKSNDRPCLAFQKKMNVNGEDMYCFSDSHFMTFTNDCFLPLFDDLTEDEKKYKFKNAIKDYPMVDRIINVNDEYKCDLTQVDFNDIEAKRKSKDENLTRYELTFKGKESYVEHATIKYRDCCFTSGFDVKYLMIAYDLLDIKKNIKDIVCYTSFMKKLSLCVIKNIKTNEAVYIMPMK